MWLCNLCTLVLAVKPIVLRSLVIDILKKKKEKKKAAADYRCNLEQANIIYTDLV